MEVPSGWYEQRLPPEADTRAVREYIKKQYPKMGFKILSRGVDRDFVVSEESLRFDERRIARAARGDDPYDDSETGKENEPPEPGIVRTDTWLARTSGLIRRVTFGRLRV